MMASTNTKMMNVDLESGFSFPSTISKPPPTQDTKVPLSTTSDDIQKPITCCSHSGKRLIAISALVLSALLVGMIVATVVIFSLGMHHDREIHIDEGRHNTTGGHHHRHHLNHTRPTTTTEEDVKDDAPENKYWYWFYPSSSDDSYSSWYYYWSSNPDQPPSNPGQPPSNPGQPPSNPGQPPSNPGQPPATQPPPVQPGSGLTWVGLESICGRGNASPDIRIVNGDTVANEKVWPWAPYLSTSNGQFFCGAELISPRWAVTAAHCVEGIAPTTPLRLTFGQLDQNAPPSPTRVEVTTTNIISHPNYNSGTTNNDIALLRLATPVDITPVCVNSNVFEHTAFQSTETIPNPCYVVGWGATSSGGPSPGTLQQVASPLVSNQRCDAAYGGITEQMICTDTNNNSGSCQGDSGGPMMCRKTSGTASGDVWELVGITSFGIGCANPAYPDVLARVSKLYSWIRSEMGETNL
ncbi:transmembrane protease serine 11C-like [Amphiura filiformis]|uniref:transmembrane protease serine 11C-like n=1 Tax=Amphiura filiformis TaxID=82378 RepID=UPI003B213A7C